MHTGRHHTPTNTHTHTSHPRKAFTPAPQQPHRICHQPPSVSQRTLCRRTCALNTDTDRHAQKQWAHHSVHPAINNCFLCSRLRDARELVEPCRAHSHTLDYPGRHCVAQRKARAILSELSQVEEHTRRALRGRCHLNQEEEESNPMHTQCFFSFRFPITQHCMRGQQPC
jgi:hypothetical protein